MAGKARNILKNVFITIGESSVDPPDPPEGQAVIWLSDGTGSGGDGDLMVKTTAGGSTLVDTLNDLVA